jgi:small-conductance mechanosensitive channel
MNSAQKHFLLTLGSIVIGLVISLICAYALWLETGGLLHLFGLWFGGFVIAAASSDYLGALSEYREVEEFSV